MEYSQTVKAAVFDTAIASSNLAIPASLWIFYQKLSTRVLTTYGSVLFVYNTFSSYLKQVCS